jgi:DNA polymerase-3 subunit chi
MTRVDFYLSRDDKPDSQMRLACRLAEKAWKLGHSIYIHLADANDGKALDDLMWTFRDGSFVPHGHINDTASATDPVLIGWQAEPPDDRHDVLINLSGEVPAFFSRFQRVAEIVSGAETAKTRARERYRFYRDRGYDLTTHDL